MKNASLLCVMAAVAAFAANADAVYKCTTPKGVAYQDRPCREGTETDVKIVIPTGEVASKSASASDDDAQADGPQVPSYFGKPRPGRTAGDDPASAAKPAAGKAPTAAGANPAADTPKKVSRAGAANSSVPMTAEQARSTPPAAKYYTTDVASSGSNTPDQMTCESPTGEKRRFVLTNGKFTSI